MRGRVLIALLACLPAAAAAAAQRAVVIRNVTVIPMTGGAPSAEGLPSLQDSSGLD